MADPQTGKVLHLGFNPGPTKLARGNRRSSILCFAYYAHQESLLMPETELSILYLEDRPGYAGVVHQYLSEITGFSCHCIRRDTLAAALSEIERELPKSHPPRSGVPDAG